MAAPFFSILTAAYNAEPFIARTVASVLGQTNPNWEWIVINDGSTDRTWEMVTRLTQGHPRVRLLENPRNLGQQETLNRALKEAQGEWIGYLHADDSYRFHALETVENYVRDRPELILWAHSQLYIHQDGTPHAIVIDNYIKRYETERLAETFYLKGAIFGGMSNHLFRRPDPSLGLHFMEKSAMLDTNFWIRYLLAHPGRQAVYYPDVLSLVTQHADSISSIIQANGEDMVNLFTIPPDLARFDWPLRVRLHQIVRMLWCWLRFFPRLPQDERLLPARTLGGLIRNLFSTRRGDKAIATASQATLVVLASFIWAA